MAGPPMSISSMLGSLSNGYRLTTTRSIGCDAVLGHVGLVRRIGGVGQQAAVHLRVQRDDPVVEDRRNPGQVGQVGGRDPGGDDRSGRATTADDGPAGPVQTGGQLDDAGLVEDGEEGDGHGRQGMSSTGIASESL